VTLLEIDKPIAGIVDTIGEVMAAIGSFTFREKATLAHKSTAFS